MIPGLIVDTYYTDVMATLLVQGWLFTSIGRYDPTSLAGTTPTGKAFTFTAVSNPDDSITGTMTIAGNTNTSTMTVDQGANWEAATTNTIFVTTLLLFPVLLR